MADVKKVSDLQLPDEFDGLPVHLMVKESDPVQRPARVEAVGYHQDYTDIVEWFDVAGDVAKAQGVIDSQVVPAVRAYLEVAPPAPEPAEPEEIPADKPLTAAQVKAAAKRAAPAKK